MKILLLCRFNRQMASSRLRFFQYLPYLQELGAEIQVAPLLGADYVSDLISGKRRRLTPILSAYLRRLKVLLEARRYDVLWIEKELFPWLPGWGEQLLALAGVPFVVDYDDAIYHNYDSHKNSLVRCLLAEKIDKVMRRAALVIAGNAYLAARAHRAGAQRIEILPTVVDIDRYPAVKNVNNNNFMIGWIGAPYTAKYLSLIQPALAEVCTGQAAKMILVGSGPLILKDVPTEIKKWTEDTEIKEITSFDVGIMPLPDDPFERGKCGYKLIQYMACGKPVVASPVGANREIVEHGVNGFLARNLAEWVAYLTIFHKDRGVRERMGRAGRQKVEAEYCLQMAAPRLAKWLQEAAARPVRARC